MMITPTLTLLRDFGDTRRGTVGQLYRALLEMQHTAADIIIRYINGKFPNLCF